MLVLIKRQPQKALQSGAKLFAFCAIAVDHNYVRRRKGRVDQLTKEPLGCLRQAKQVFDLPEPHESIPSHFGISYKEILAFVKKVFSNIV